MKFLSIFNPKKPNTPKKDILPANFNNTTKISKTEAEDLIIECLRRSDRSRARRELEDKSQQIKQLKLDKAFLEKQIERLNKTIDDFKSGNVFTPEKGRLSKTEQKIYDIYVKKKPKTDNALASLTKRKIQHLRVNLCNMRKKGYEMRFPK